MFDNECCAILGDGVSCIESAYWQIHIYQRNPHPLGLEVWSLLNYS